MDYTDRLRRLAINDAQLRDECVRGGSLGPRELDPKTFALVRLGALVAVGGEAASYGEHADAAVEAGASAPEIVDVLISVVPLVGLPKVVAAAPRLAIALGYDIEAAL